MQWVIRVLGWIGLVVWLTGCGVGGAPPREVVEKAIALQIAQTQTVLEQQLYRGATPAIGFAIDHVRIREQQSIPLSTPASEDDRGYRVRGTYDITLDFPERQVKKRKNDFEVYLQRQATGKLWNLASPSPSDPVTPGWILQPIE